MSRQYDQYIEEHRSNVLKGFEWLMQHIPEIAICKDSLESIIKNHDMSKYSLDEYNQYDAYFYGNNKSYQVKENFNKAWLYHIHRNKHHWQYWVVINDDPNEVNTYVEMPCEYVIEMICDWWSFSWKEGNLYGIFDWYEEHKNKMELHEDTRKLVEYILNRIKEKLKELGHVTTNNEKKPKIIAVDFDGTLCTNKYPEIGEPKLEVIKYIKEQREQGAKVILWTCRIGQLLANAVNWCQNHGIALDAVNENLPEVITDFDSNTRKIFANEYIDDRNFWPVKEEN